MTGDFQAVKRLVAGRFALLLKKHLCVAMQGKKTRSF